MKKKAYKILYYICIITLLLSSCYFVYDFFIVDYFAEKSVEDFSSFVVDVPKKDEVDFKAEYKKKYPDVNFPEGLLTKYYPAYAQNQDLRGWISVPEHGVDLPVVQASNNDYYLKKDINKSYSAWGTPFLDSENKLNPCDRNLIIYAHNSRYKKQQDKMFAAFNVYTTLEGYKKAPVITFDTIYEEAKWKVYAVFITNTNPADDNGYVFNYLIRNASDDVFGEFLYEIKERSLYDTGVSANKTDTFLTLSTCNYTFKDARLVIVCRKVRPGESLNIDSSGVTMNQNPRYPQAFYDKNKLVNPYADAYKWNP